MNILIFKKICIIFFIVWVSPLQAHNSLTSYFIDYLMTPDFSEIKDTKERKAAFFKHLLPIVEKENKKIKTIRSLIKNDKFSDRRINKLAKKYRLENPNKQELLATIDIVPTSLVLAQAAIESNWGRSRFSRRWHNYFGIWCFHSGCGVVPKNRDKNAKHEVMQFSSTNKAVEYYLLNINRNQAYDKLRQIRKHKRKHGLKLSGASLAEGLENYSGIGYEYIELVQGVIRQNNLLRFD